MGGEGGGLRCHRKQGRGVFKERIRKNEAAAVFSLTETREGLQRPKKQEDEGNTGKEQMCTIKNSTVPTQKKRAHPIHASSPPGRRRPEFIKRLCSFFPSLFSPQGLLYLSLLFSGPAPPSPCLSPFPIHPHGPGFFPASFSFLREGLSLRMSDLRDLQHIRKD